MAGVRRTHDFTHVENDDGRFETDTKTSNDTSSDNGTKGIDLRTSDHLNNDTDQVDQAAHNDSPFTTNSLSDVTSDESSKESTSGENGGDERCVGRA